MNSDLDAYIKERSRFGHQIAQVNWLDVVKTYGYGNNTPAAMRRYLKAVAAQTNLEYVLIVGGHTFDYLGVQSDEVVNFVPAFHRRVGDFNFTPTDNPMVDFDGDEVADISIGRWPVRSAQDLKYIIAKSLKWQLQRSSGEPLQSLLIAEPEDGRGLSHTDSVIGMVKPKLDDSAHYDVNALLRLDQLDDGSSQTLVAQAREMAKAEIDAGVDLVSYAGHGSPVAWGNQGIFNTEFVNSLANAGNPVAVMPLACYTTYYQSTGINTLAHQWLFAGKHGAAVVHGPAVLGEYRENAVFAERVLESASTSTSFGAAILNAKNASGSGNQMIQNWTLLGDPSLPMH